MPLRCVEIMFAETVNTIAVLMLYKAIVCNAIAIRSAESLSYVFVYVITIK